jgi:protein transport protein SEC61 subunit alpha
MRFLDLFRPISRFIPEVAPPQRKVQFNTRLLWTVAAMVVFLIMSETPLYGIPQTQTGDPYAAMRMTNSYCWAYHPAVSRFRADII